MTRWLPLALTFLLINSSHGRCEGVCSVCVNPVLIPNMQIISGRQRGNGCRCARALAESWLQRG
ncbi:hypothetical protein ACNKHL_15355 [Shigella flexneri]